MSSTVLVVDDLPIIRDPIAATLSAAGYHALRAGNGAQALEMVRANHVDLILLDVTMPVMDGVSFLRILRRDSLLGSIPVIMLTGAEDREDVLLAAKFGVKGYVLKSNFSLRDLLVRVTQHFSGLKQDGGCHVTTQPSTHAATDVIKGDKKCDGPAQNSAAGAGRTSAIPVLLDREQCLARAKQALHGKTLSGIVADVISLTASPRGDAAILTAMISRDPLLSARVLQVANSSAYVTRGGSSILSDAVRHIGCASLRDIAAAFGVFDAMPATDVNGLNQLRCWQHSFAVATLCNHFAQQKDAGVAYLVGLCHDLGEILFQSEFAEEHRQLLELERSTGKPREEIEKAVLGITRLELLQTIVTCLGLPREIGNPILEYQAKGASSRTGSSLTQLLRAADLYANGMLLACSNQSPVRPLSVEEAKAVTDSDNPAPPDRAAVRGKVLSLTATLSRFSPDEQAQLMMSPYARKPIRIWLARDAALSSVDPIEAALSLLADVSTHTALPVGDQAADCQGIIAMAPSGPATGGRRMESNTFTGPNQTRIPILWLVGRGDGTVDDAERLTWPISIARLAEFVATIN